MGDNDSKISLGGIISAVLFVLFLAFIFGIDIVGIVLHGSVDFKADDGKIMLKIDDGKEVKQIGGVQDDTINEPENEFDEPKTLLDVKLDETDSEIIKDKKTNQSDVALLVAIPFFIGAVGLVIWALRRH